MRKYLANLVSGGKFQELEETIKKLQRHIYTLCNSIEEKDRIVSEQEMLLDSRGVIICNLNNRISENDIVIRNLRTNLDAAILENSSIKGELSKKNDCIEILNNKNDELNSNVEVLEHEITIKDTSVTMLNGTIEQLNSLINEKNDCVDSLKSEVKKLSQEKRQLEDEVNINGKKLQECENIIAELQNSSKTEICATDSHALDENGTELMDRIEVLEKERLILLQQNKEKDRLYDDLRIKYDIIENNVEFYKKRINELEESLGTNVVEIANSSNPIVVSVPENDTMSSCSNTSVIPQKLTIDAVIDVDNGEELDAKEFFSKSQEEIIKMRRVLQDAIILDKPKYVCKYCGQMVKISGKRTERGHASFFSHLYDSDDCDLKTTTGLSKALINARKYGSYGESERHKKTKKVLVELLNGDTSKEKGISNVEEEKTIFGFHPLFKWRRPDIHVKYKDIDIVFEIQLSTTFASVIAEREMFYRMNNIFIIWVFNFSDNEEFVDLRNLMMKDIYFCNHRNIFVIDKESYHESLKRKELVLKCDWLENDGTWHHSGTDNYGGKGEFITLSDLTYNTATYKPFFHDTSSGQDLMADNLSNERDLQNIISLLDKKYGKVLECQKNEDIERKRILDALDVDEVVKEYKRLDVAIVSKEGRYGLYNYVNKKEVLPTIYRSIKLWNNSRYFLVEDEKSRFGLYNNRGKEIVETKYNFIPKPENGVSLVTYVDETSGFKKYSLIDSSNLDSVKEIGDYLSIEALNDVYMVTTREVKGAFLKGVIRNNGTIIHDNKYTQLLLFSNDLFHAVYKGKHGIIGMSSNWILPFEYDNIEYLIDGKARVCKNGKYGYINAEGKILYDSVALLNSVEQSEKRLFMGTWQMYSRYGNLMDKNYYSEIAHYQGQVVAFTQEEIKFHKNIRATKDCGLEAELIDITKTGCLFKIGDRVAKMNRRQLQRKPKDIQFVKGQTYKVYISCIKEELNLIYLSPIPCFGPALNQRFKYNR